MCHQPQLAAKIRGVNYTAINGWHNCTRILTKKNRNDNKLFTWYSLVKINMINDGSYLHLSHTWVRYPGFSGGHGVKCPILTTVVPGFSGDLIGCTIRIKWGSFGDLYLARKNHLCVWNKLFLAEINFPKGELAMWSLYGDKLSICRNQQMNGKI